jgi:Cytosine/adenosine deaminases
MSRLPFEITPLDEDEKWMIEALKQAWVAFENDEVPVGAVLVHKGSILAKGSNQVELLRDATAHAEMLCITSASAQLENWRLAETTLYSTLEPCAMCAGALFLSRVPRLVYGAKDIRHGAAGSWTDLFALKHPTHQIEIKGDVLAPYSSELLKTFFDKQRKKRESV